MGRFENPIWLTVHPKQDVPVAPNFVFVDPVEPACENEKPAGPCGTAGLN
jgi:hypothetical protein